MTSRETHWSIGRRIKLHRRMHGWDRFEFADKLGVEYDELVLMERGCYYGPTSEMLQNVAKSLGLEYEDLIWGSQEIGRTDV